MEYAGSPYTFIAVVASTIYCLWVWYRRHLERKKPFGNELPMVPNSHWLRGHGPKYMAGGKDFLTTLQSLHVDYGNQYGQVSHWLGNIPVMSVMNWKDAKAVLLAEYNHREIGLLGKYAKRLLGEKTILLLNGREWKLHRTPIVRSFIPDALNDARNDIDDVTKSVVMSIRERMNGDRSLELDMEQVTKMITVDVFAKTALSTDLGCCEALAPTSIATSFEFLTKDFMRRMQRPFTPKNRFYWIPTPDNRRHNQERATVRSYLIDILKARRDPSKKNKLQNRRDLLTNLQKAHLNDAELKQPDANADALLSDVLITLFFAGYDTTSITLSYVLYLLSKNPQIEQNCLDEINSLSKLNNPDDLVYCTSVVLETLRLYPPALQTLRHLQKPIKLSGGFVAPKGATIMIPIWFIQRSERNFPKPLEFRPDRWVKRNTKADGSGRLWINREILDKSGPIPAGNRDAVFAFSAGGRSCPGSKFAMQEATLVLAHLLNDLKFSTAADFEITPTRRMALQRPETLPMKVEIRS